MKLFIYSGITIGGILGGFIGLKLDGGNGLGGWSLLLGGLIGPLFGLWLGYRLGKSFSE